MTSIGDHTYVVYPDGRLYSGGGTDGANCTVAVCPVAFSVYGYRPNLAASSTLIALYAICALIQVVMGFRYKTWGFMIAMVLGCIDEILGYVGRIFYWQNPWGEVGFIMQICMFQTIVASLQLTITGLITMGPVFFAAAIYVMIYKM